MPESPVAPSDCDPCPAGFIEALREIGVVQLSADEARLLDQAGYVVLGAVVDGHLDELRQAFETVVEPAQRDPAVVPSKTGTRHAAGLLWRPIFRAVGLHPRLLAAARYVLRRRFVLRDIGARDPLPGFGRQALHADWHTPPVDGTFAVVTALCLLDDFTCDNGATRVVPGTHRLSARLDKTTATPQFRHPREVTIQATAGSVLLFNGHLWHSATTNRGKRSRRSLQICYLANELRDRNLAPPPEAMALSSAERYLLGFDHMVG